MQIQLTINGKHQTLTIKGNETLLELLRDQLGLTGTKTSCQESECGACTVIIKGKAVLSCITLAANLDGESVRTIESLATGDVLHPVQKAFIEHGSVQCGFCIPGMIMSSTALLEKNPTPSKTEIEYALDGNICRCASYHKIAQAVEAAGLEMKEGSLDG